MCECTVDARRTTVMGNPACDRQQVISEDIATVLEAETECNASL